MPGKRNRAGFVRERLKAAMQTGIRIVIDLDFDDLMNDSVCFLRVCFCLERAMGLMRRFHLAGSSQSSPTTHVLLRRESVGPLLAVPAPS
jgi:hypothetical protein